VQKFIRYIILVIICTRICIERQRESFWNHSGESRSRSTNAPEEESPKVHGKVQARKHEKRFMKDSSSRNTNFIRKAFACVRARVSIRAS